MSAGNPYRWTFDDPTNHVERGRLRDEVMGHLRRGDTVRLVGGRGMGKTVLLRDLERELASVPGTRVVRLSEAPTQPTEAAALAALALTLGQPARTWTTLGELLDTVLVDPVERVALLLDEADEYVSFARRGEVNAAFVRAWTNRLETARKDRKGSFVVVIAGGLGLLYLAHELGSALVSRAKTVTMSPFSREDVRGLAAPFEARGAALDEQTLDRLYLASGGHPGLVTYGFECLWDLPVIDAASTERIYGRFREEHPDFVRQVWASISRRDTLEAPRRALDVVYRNAGMAPLTALRDACAADPQEHRRDPVEVLQLLLAAGLIRVEGALTSDPVAASPTATIFNLPDVPASKGDALDDTVANVEAVLRCMRRFGLDFYREDKLVHEDVFSSFIATGLLLLGWRHVEREALQQGGYVDVKLALQRATHPGHIVVEVKKWGNKDKDKVHQQALDYRTSSTVGAVVVMIATAKERVSVAEYKQTCIAGCEVDDEAAPSDLVGRWTVLHKSGGPTFRVVHLLIELPQRKATKGVA